MKTLLPRCLLFILFSNFIWGNLVSGESNIPVISPGDNTGEIITMNNGNNSSLPPFVKDHTLSKSISQYTGEISQESDIFTEDDRGVISSVRFDNLTSPPAIEWEWYDPSGNILWDSVSKPFIGKKYAYQHMWIPDSSVKSGEWTVKILLEGEVIDTKTFTVNLKERTFPSTNSYSDDSFYNCDRTCGGQCCPEGMRCCNDLKNGPTCYDPSTTTCDRVSGRSDSSSCGDCPEGWVGPDEECMCRRTAISTPGTYVQPQVTKGPDPMELLDMDFGYGYTCTECPPGWSGPDENCVCTRWVYSYT